MNSTKLLFSAFLSFLQLTAFGQTTTLTLDNIPPNILCNEIWTEQNLDLSIVNATADDCGVGACSFGVDPTVVWLFPSRLTIDLSSLQGIQKIEVDIQDFCELNCTRAFLMDSIGMVLNNAGNTISGSSETLTIENPTEGFLSELAISSCEGQVQEVRIYQNITSSIQIASEEALIAYPNPSTSIDDLHFKISTSSTANFPKRIDIFSANGKLVYSQETDTVTDINSLFIPAKNLSKGVFFVQFKLGDSFFTQKIVRF